MELRGRGLVFLLQTKQKLEIMMQILHGGMAVALEEEQVI